MEVMAQEVHDLHPTQGSTTAKFIYESRWFGLMGHLYFAARVAQLDPIAGSDLHIIFSAPSKINHPTAEALDLVSLLVSLYLWTDPRMLNFNMSQSSIPTQLLINEVKGTQHKPQATDPFKQDLLHPSQQQRIQASLTSIENKINTLELEWPPIFASAVKGLHQRIKESMNNKNEKAQENN